MSQTNLTTGLLAAIAVLAFWSGFIVFSRAGVLDGLTPYDVAGLRFLVAGAMTLPFAYAWWPRALPWRIQILMALVGPGAIYSVLLFLGLAQASAAYGGVFANGALPIFTMLLTLAVIGARPRAVEIIAALVIIAGGVMVAWKGLSAGGQNVALGIVLFLGASCLISTYIFLLKRHGVAPKQALTIINVPNALIYVPIWLLVLPSALGEVPIETVLAQAAFQGIGPGFLAVITFALMAYHLGATPTAAISASVPAAAALLAVPVLGEIPTQLEWAGIGVVSLGLLLMVARR